MKYSFTSISVTMLALLLTWSAAHELGARIVDEDELKGASDRDNPTANGNMLTSLVRQTAAFVDGGQQDAEGQLREGFGTRRTRRGIGGTISLQAGLPIGIAGPLLYPATDIMYPGVQHSYMSSSHIHTPYAGGIRLMKRSVPSDSDHDQQEDENGEHRSDDSLTRLTRQIGYYGRPHYRPHYGGQFIQRPVGGIRVTGYIGATRPFGYGRPGGHLGLSRPFGYGGSIGPVLP